MRSAMYKQTLTLITALVGLFLQAQRIDNDGLDRYLDALDDSKQCMVSVAIHFEGKEVYSRAIGFRNVEEKLSADKYTRYRIGSISKSFTAVLVMQMVESGDLRLDQLLSEFFPELPNADKINITHLLRHQSGLFNFTNASDYEDYNTSPVSRQSMLDRIASYPIQFNPGEKTAYSNANYVLLSYILEDVSQESYAILLEQRIAAPLGLDLTSSGATIDPTSNEAYSYEKMGEWMKFEETHPTIPMGAGNIVSTPSDLNVFFHALFAGKLLSPASLEKMVKLEDNFGLGLFSFPYQDQRAFGHTGGIDQFRSMSGHFREDGWTVSAITNGCNIQLNDVMIQLLNATYGEEVSIPEFKEDFVYTEEELRKFEGTYSGSGFPIKITIRKKGLGLEAQATGQPAFSLQSTEENVFEFKAAGVRMQFFPDNGKMRFEQGQVWELSKEQE